MKRNLLLSRPYSTSVVLLLLVSSLATAVKAELPPYVYKEWQQKAPESLVIKILSVKTEETDEPRLARVAVTLEARVERVSRSRSGLKPGEVIRIRYEHRRHKEPLAGPSEVPVLKKGRSYPAYLKRGEMKGEYTPAAGGYSFREVK